ncbi:MAG: hypothetical protein M3P08_21095 [Thermoproteota archaeon]|nr:hypothetical protein [Thermoproteota archaeon]
MSIDLFGWGQFIGSLATTGALIVLAVQTYLNKKQISLTQQQMDSTLRPWIGFVTSKSPSLCSQGGFVSVILKNYSQSVPAKTVTFRAIIREQQITKDDILSDNPTPTGSLLPGEERGENKNRSSEFFPLPKLQLILYFSESNRSLR